MSLSIRPLRDNDYNEILINWWKDWGWTPPLKDFLPESGTGGMIVYDEHIPVCAGFVYITNSAVAWIEFIISNKQYRKKPEKKMALKYLVEILTSVAEKSGKKYCYTLLKSKPLINIYKELGYVEGDSNALEMIKKI